MFRIFTETPELLRKGRLLKFQGDFNDTIRNNDVVEITQSVVISYKKGFIIPPDDRIAIQLDNSANGLRLYPTDDDTLYEILIGFKWDGNFLIYPQFPAGRYLWRLDDPTMYPDPTADDERRYVGAIKPEDSPSKKPKVRTYTLKDMEPLILEVSNVGNDYGKLIFEFTINKCRFQKLTRRDLEGYTLIYREVLHPDLMRF